MLAMPRNVVRSHFVQSKAEERCVLSRLSCHIKRLLCTAKKRPTTLRSASAARNLVLASTPHPSRISIVTAQLTNTQGEVLGIQSVVGHEGFTLAVSQDDSPYGKYLSGGTARTQGLGAAVPVEWTIPPSSPGDGSQCRRQEGLSRWSLLYQSAGCIRRVHTVSSDR